MAEHEVLAAPRQRPHLHRFSLFLCKTAEIWHLVSPHH